MQRREEKKGGKHNFITVVMRGEERKTSAEAVTLAEKYTCKLVAVIPLVR